MTMERRTFIKCTSLAGMGVLTGLTSAVATGESAAKISTDSHDWLIPPDGYEPPGWLRYSRTGYFDGYSPPLFPHLDEFDADRLVKLVQDLGCDTLRFQPVGKWAYYPTQSKYPTHPELGNRDLIAETARACRRAGLHLYCYTTYGSSNVTLDYLDRHPEYADWVAHGPDGKPFGAPGDSGGSMTPKADATGDALRGAIHQVVREYCTYDIDGAYFDAPSCQPYTGFCYCATCRRKFKAYCGMDLNRVQNPADMEAVIMWYQWFGEMERADLLEFRKTIHGSGKFMLCHNGATWRPQALREQYRIPDGFMVENQVQVYRRLMAGLMGAAMARPTKKLSQMYMGGFALSDPGQPLHSPEFEVEDTSEEDGEEILMDGFANLASGGVPIYATLNRLYYGLGSGSAEPAKEIYRFMREAEPLLQDSVPVPYVTVVPSWEALQLWRTGRTGWNVQMSEGFTLAMLDERLNLDVCPSTEVTANWLRTQRVIALCGASGLTDDLAKLLTEWVQAGGGLLATYDTGLYDENGKLRPGGALRDVLGVEIKGEPLATQPDCYYRIQANHPALGKYRSGSVVKGDGRVVPVEAVGNGQVLADGWNLGTRQTRGPSIVTQTYGRGRTVYLAGSLEAHYAASRIPAHRRLLASAVRFLAGEAPPPFTIDAPRGVYGVLRRAPDGDLILFLLANVGFKDADLGRMRQEFTPVANVAVGLLVPAGRTVKSVRWARAGRSAPFTVEAGYAKVTLPTLHIAEMVHLELAPTAG